jgi:hypothetical protein
MEENNMDNQLDPQMINQANSRLAEVVRKIAANDPNVRFNRELTIQEALMLEQLKALNSINGKFTAFIILIFAGVVLNILSAILRH